MSYDIRIWEHPVGLERPDSFEAAVRPGLELETRTEGQNPKFVQLATGLRNLSDDDNSPWVSDPVASAQRCQRLVWAFELPDRERVRLLYTVIKLANALGLTVLDDQLGLVFCPPDRVFPPDRAALWQSAANELAGETVPVAPKRSASIAAIRKELEASLDATLLPRGFVADRSPPQCPYYSTKTIAVYSRPTATGGQAVSLMVQKTRDTPTVVIDVNVFSHAITDIARAVFPEYDEGIWQRQLNFWTGMFHGDRCYMHVHTRDDVQRILKSVESPVLAILDQTCTAAGMQAVLSGAMTYPLPGYGGPNDPASLSEFCIQNFGYTALISAWQHGSDQFEAIRQAMREITERDTPQQMREEMCQRLDQVVDHLRKHVPRVAQAPD